MRHLRRKPRPSLKSAIEWIAANDEPSSRSVEVIATLPSVKLVAELFGKTSESIAVRVAAARAK